MRRRVCGASRGGAPKKSHPTPPCRARGGPRPHRQFTPTPPPTNLHRDAHLQGAHTTTSLVHRTPTRTLVWRCVGGGPPPASTYSVARRARPLLPTPAPRAAHTHTHTHTPRKVRRAVWRTHTMGGPTLAARRLPRPQRHARGTRFSASRHPLAMPTHTRPSGPPCAAHPTFPRGMHAVGQRVPSARLVACACSALAFRHRCPHARPSPTGDALVLRGLLKGPSSSAS